MQCDCSFPPPSPRSSPKRLHNPHIYQSAGDQTGHIRVWDLTASACSCELVPEIGTAVRSLTVALDGTMIVAANNHGTCYVWRMMRGELLLLVCPPSRSHACWHLLAFASCVTATTGGSCSLPLHIPSDTVCWLACGSFASQCMIHMCFMFLKIFDVNLSCDAAHDDAGRVYERVWLCACVYIYTQAPA